MVSPFLPDDEKVAAVREGLPATGAGIYFDTGSVGPLPSETARAMSDLGDWELTTGRGLPEDEETQLRMGEARAAVAAILTSDVDSIALTHGTTDGLNIAVWSVDWRPGDRVVTTSLEHPAGLAPLWMVRERFGVDLAIVDVGDGGDDERTTAAFEEALTPMTRLVLVSHVSWANGAVLPVAAVTELAQRQGALVVVDGAQAAGAMQVDVGAIGADFYALPGSKWLLGPQGTGALYCGPRAFMSGRQALTGVASFEQLDQAANGQLWRTARRFEASAYHRPSIVGLARSCGWLSMYVGLEWLYQRSGGLARRAAELLSAIPGVRVLTPLDQMASLVTFQIDGWPAERALEELGRRVFAIAGLVPHLDAVRIGLGFFNTEDEAARFCEGVAELARHTPESLPRRVLTILGEGDG